ncbi:MAG: UDP-N-acetylmuramoyl-L-alanyl-D-glutamate--2,6-diaminopimelate ligase [bacterium]|uniref:UDP-N-acetylmuramoyl-L-alanyl-D-glutamate--2, 6-diaminopimelate ligase n=1 Tax=Candidatus Methylomirabilis tolerans TaxID=3123416 RepID=A0AAJ1AJD8_9BACT|nr:UDP-N-acetylmuramoyl-L-alanyl-D-glutamate--2,6-diaminopimelate ligase [Candidatus Methylomirabilis sp.]
MGEDTDPLSRSEIGSLSRLIERWRNVDDWRIWQCSKELTRLRTRAASTLMGHPARSLNIIGVTGTDGKTTTTELIASMFHEAGHRISWINSLGAGIAGQRLQSNWRLTTPGPFLLQGLLRWMKRSGSNWVIIEASSHGLAQGRLGGIRFSTSVVTNLTSEHLDYHRSFERYLAAKSILVRNTVRATEGGAVVLNRDDPSCDRFAVCARRPPLYFGLGQEAAVRATDIDLGDSGSRFEVCTPLGRFRISLPLSGLFNIYNALAAAAVGYTHRLDPSVIASGCQAVAGVHGRMMSIAEGQPYSVVVDFAHTPHALEQVLRFVRRKIVGRIILVFGCPGERDSGKRSAMGEVAGRLADYVVITREDNRSESIHTINRAIVAGLHQAGREPDVNYVVLSDRSEAIRYACNLAEAGDLVLITGKGHERTLNVDGQDLPWNEEAVAREAIRISMGVSSALLP